MDSMRHLISKVREKNLKNSGDSLGGAKSVIEVLDAALAENEEPPRGQAPPLDVIVYALNNILYPTFLPELLSEFLHLFSMIEFYRIRITEKAALAIEMNTYYKSTPDMGVVLLTNDDEDFLRSAIDDQESYRRIFMTIVENCCIFDLQRLWLTDPTDKFLSRWNQYLSILNDNYDELLPHSFHHKLSVDEFHHLRRVGRSVYDYMTATYHGGQQLQRERKSNNNNVTVKYFQNDQVSLEEALSTMREAIHHHQKFTQELVQKFTVIAPRTS